MQTKCSKALLLFLVFGLTLSGLAFGCTTTNGSANTGTTNSGSADGQPNPASRVYVIATDSNFAPFEYSDEQGKLVGLDTEILAAVAADQGFEYQLDPVVGFSAAKQEVISGVADGVMAGMSITSKHREDFDFSASYFDSGVVMGVAASNTDIRGFDDLAGKKVAVKIGTEGETFAISAAPQYGFEIVPFEDSSTMREDVLAGNSQALFGDYQVLGYAIAHGEALRFASEMERGSSYGFAVAKNQHADLLQMFDAGLANLKANGTYQRILDKYLN